jgi:signal peptidase
VGNGALVFGILVLIGLAVGPKLSLYRTVTVLSGSMRPTFDPGDVILVTPEPTRDLRLGQIITYQIPTGAKQVESHRVVRILRHGNTPIVQTRGDANTGLDPWQAELHGGTLWRFRFRIPLLGYPILALRTHIAHLLLVIVFPILFALYALAEVWRPRDRPRMAHAQQTR